MGVDTSQLQLHVVNLQVAANTSRAGVRAATRLAGQRVRDMAKNTFQGTRYWTKYAPALTYDIEQTADSVTAWIGPLRGGQGSFGHLLEYGGHEFGPIKPHLGPALDANAEVYEKALLAAVSAPLGAGVTKMGRVKR